MTDFMVFSFFSISLSNDFSTQNLRQIGLGVLELWSDIQKIENLEKRIYQSVQVWPRWRSMFDPEIRPGGIIVSLYLCAQLAVLYTYNETSNNEYIGRIYQMSSWQFFNDWVPYNHLIKKLNICNIPLSESEEYDIWWILSMYSLLRGLLYNCFLILIY